MISNAVIIGLVAWNIYITYELRDQIEELRERQGKLFMRIAINEIQRNTAPARNKNKGGTDNRGEKC